MKRLLAILLSIFFSISNNSSFAVSEYEKPFISGNYFMVEEDSAPDYRELYKQGIQITAGNNCVTTTRTVKSAYTIASRDETYACYWVDPNSEVKTFDDIKNLTDYCYVFSKAGDIVAPLGCTIITQANDGGGSKMLLKFNGNDYYLHIENMYCWYCCRNKKDYDGVDISGNPCWVHTESITGKTILPGQMIGRAKEGTKVYLAIGNSNTSIRSTPLYKLWDGK